MELSVLVSLLFLGGCATMPPPVITFSSCPAIKLYTEQEEQAVEQAKQQLPKNSPINGFISDYGQLRAEARACQNIK